MPELGRAAGLCPQSPTLLGLTSSILLTLEVVGLSECLLGDRSAGKHGVKECRCLMEQTDSSAERDFLKPAESNLEEGKWPGRHCLETSVMFRVVDLKEDVYGQKVLYFVTCHCPLQPAAA